MTTSPWPARTDILQSLSGLLLVLFVWAHMFFESSILLGMEAMYWVTGLFEGRHFFGRPYPVLVSLVAAVILLLVVVHAVLALRKLPASWAEHRLLRQHLNTVPHGDSSLWYLQAVSGVALLFLLPAHLFTAMLQPENIGPYASSDRIWSGRFWLLYAPLLLVVHLHAGAGAYRLLLKWRPPTGGNARAVRRRLRATMWCTIGFFMLLGTASLATYMKIGMAHADRAGERYVPAQHGGGG